tara:strand:- start:365 stop:1282 length:918 start_codon:yes stop_codon:yes gene_type:complete
MSSNYAAPSRLGENAGTSTNAKELFLKTFTGEVLTAFNTNNIAMPLHRVRTISQGSSAQFPLTGIATTATLAAGNEVVPSAITHSEKVVNINDLLTSSVFIAKIDEAMNHYDVRSIYSTEIGTALAKAADTTIFTKIAAATDDTAEYAQGASQNNADVEFAGTGAATTGSQVADGIFAALEALDTKNVTGEKYVVLDADTYYRLFTGSVSNLAGVMSSDFGSGGNLNSGTVPQIGGAKVFMSNNLPSGSKGLVFTKDAAATVKLLDLAVESEYQVSRQGTLMVARYAMGHDSLRPECAVKLVNAL